MAQPSNTMSRNWSLLLMVSAPLRADERAVWGLAARSGLPGDGVKGSPEVLHGA